MLTDVTAESGPARTGNGALDRAAFEAAAAGVRAQGLLGRSRLQAALFDYLVLHAFDARPPKEAQIAHEVFGRPAAFAADQDAIVRVCAHRLRIKLDRAAHRPGAPRLVLRPGQYRLTLVAGAPASPPRPTWFPATLFRRYGGAMIVLAAVALLAGVEVAARSLDPGAQVLRAPIWRPIIESPRPLLLVVGDYYIVGQSDDGYEVSRLVREYGINSKADLDAYLLAHPDKVDRLQDLGLTYLPTSSATAVSALTAVLSRRKAVRVITASRLSAQALKTYDVVYVGYLSGLGPLRDQVFAGSRYRVGETYDDLVDLRGGGRYRSEAALGPVGGGLYDDYSYVASFRGAAGNRIMIVAGLRDIGAAAAAEQVTTPAGVRRLSGPVGAREFEALYRVRGQGEVGYDARLLTAADRAASAR